MSRPIFAASVIAVSCLSALVPEPTDGQIPVRDLMEPDHVYAQDFTFLRDLRPLSDGRILAIEGMGSEVLMLDGRGTTSKVGRRGEGPSEYAEPVSLLAVGPSDFTLLVDEAQRRLLVLDAGGRVLAAEPWRLPVGTRPRARDAEEGIYYDELGLVRLDARGAVLEGPAPIMRVLPGGVPDTLAFVQAYDLADRWAASPVSRMFSPGPGGVGRLALDRSPFGAQDQWTVTGDGRIVVVRARPYRLEILSSDGSPLATGPEIPFDPVPVSQGDRDAFFAGLSRGAGALPMGFNSVQGGRVDVARPSIDEASFDFPETKPPFPAGALHVLPSGRALVQRHVEAGAPHSLIDVFDAEGRRVEQFHLPPGRTLVGAGEGVLYAISYSPLDLQILERYRVD